MKLASLSKTASRVSEFARRVSDDRDQEERPANPNRLKVFVFLSGSVRLTEAPHNRGAEGAVADPRIG